MGGIAYRIYVRREDETLFMPLGTTTNLAYATGHSWATGGLGTNWFYSVVAVAADGAESPYQDIVMNSQPTLARFTANLTSGTPPLGVTFADQSAGGITSWAWDFDSDGTVDSTEPNPTVAFGEPGDYTVTLTVVGPNGEDTKVAVGFVSVVLPSFSAVRLLPDQTPELDLSAQAGRSYELESSTNLLDWTSLTTIVATNTITTVRDAESPAFKQRFYRVRLP
jgi:PKD repeat protein